MKIVNRQTLLRLLCAVALGLCGLALADFLLHPLAKDFVYQSTAYRAVSILVLTPITLFVGFLIMRRVPGNIIGPLLILWSATVAFGALRRDIGPIAFALFSFYEIVIGWFALFLLVLHFPDGKIYPPGAARWVYPLLWTTGFLNGLLFLGHEFISADWPNPFYLSALNSPAQLFLWLSLLSSSPWLFLAMIAPVLRYRKGSHLERQQIKWLTLFGVFLVASTFLGFVVYPALTGATLMNRGDNLFSMVFFFGTGLLPPLTIGVAVLRYRLWDIDVLIRRTLVYSVLTGLLALAYFGSVLALENLLRFMTSQGQNQLVAVVSTLAIAVLFVPLRARVQSLIDRRFYRRKYDAAKTVAAFGSAMRDEVELSQLTNRLIETVNVTMQPASVGLWVKPVPAPNGSEK